MSDVVHIYYTSDETLQEDEEIQGFVKDVCSFGMQDFDHCGGYTSPAPCVISSFKVATKA